ncbi:MAG: hypothetical protein PVJ26_17200 [Anaerolineae bacterium]|jgi:4-amino-4-deoxy-L-arabinose transferase-like glycosyltransferase
MKPSHPLTHYAFLIAILLLGLALRLMPWNQNRFLEDEALYATWGLQIASGADAMLNEEPVDKPPLHPYTLALTYLAGSPGPADIRARETLARLPSLFASMTSIALIYALGWALFRDAITGLLAALLLALSPIDILFASTAFTDPLLVALVLGSVVAAARGRLGMAGLWLGLSVATKQQGLLFLPLVVALGLLVPAARDRRNRRAWLLFLLGFALVLVGVIAWDAARLQKPGFWQQGFISYGDLGHIDVQRLGARAISWLDVLGAFWASPVFGLFLVASIMAWPLSSFAIRVIPRPATIDWVLMGFVVAMLLLHWLVGFQIWDRYLLGLVPLVALLATRAWVALGRALPARHWRPLYVMLLLLIIGLGLLRPVTLAAQSRVPVGGDHGAYDGIDELAAYLRDQAPAGSVLYHYWLGYHYRFYLHGAALRLHWYPDLADLIHDAYVYRRESRYIAFPSFRDSHEIMSGLEQAGFTLVPILETERRDGTTSFRLYRLDGPEEQP